MVTSPDAPVLLCMSDPAPDERRGMLGPFPQQPLRGDLHPGEQVGVARVKAGPLREKKEGEAESEVSQRAERLRGGPRRLSTMRP